MRTMLNLVDLFARGSSLHLLAPATMKFTNTFQCLARIVVKKRRDPAQIANLKDEFDLNSNAEWRVGWWPQFITFSDLMYKKNF